MRIVVDARDQSPLRRIWRYVGYDECNYTYAPNGRRLLRKLGRLTDGPYYIRAHFLLCSGDGTGRPNRGSTNVYTENESGTPIYDWEIIDRIFDTYIETGNIPFVEIGFMPRAMSTAPPDLTYDDPFQGGWRFPPRSYDRWQELVVRLAAHCAERYGQREVSRWYWELWNEPDIFYWAGTTAEYCRLYDHTAAGLLSVLPNAKIGGPATTSPGNPRAAEFLRAFLDHCVNGTNAVTGARGTRLDYVSFHTKGGRYRTDVGAQKQTPSIETLVHHVEEGLKIIAEFPDLRHHEVVLSECDPDGWAAGSRFENPNLQFRNTAYYASYVATAVCQLIDLSADSPARIDGMLTWAFEFEGRGYFEGLRTLSTNDVDKAVLNVFRALGRLGGQRLALRIDPSAPPPDHARVSGLAAQNADDEVQVLLVSHHDDWDVQGTTTAEVEVTGLGEGSYRVRRFLIDAEQSNAHTIWQHLGEPPEPTPEQLATLKRAARLRLQEEKLVRAVDDRVTLRTNLSTHAICLYELVPDFSN